MAGGCNIVRAGECLALEGACQPLGTAILSSVMPEHGAIPVQEPLKFDYSGTPPMLNSQLNTPNTMFAQIASVTSGSSRSVKDLCLVTDGCAAERSL